MQPMTPGTAAECGQKSPEAPSSHLIETSSLELVVLDPYRPDWAATPALPWKSIEASSNGDYTLHYIAHAYEKLDKRLAENLAELPSKPPRNVVEMVHSSMLNALSRRVAQNHWQDISLDLLNDPAFAASRQGNATPRQLIQLALNHPELHAIELAKLTSPFKWSALLGADIAVAEGAESYDFEVNEDQPRYYIARVDDQTDPRAAIIIRKEPLLDIDGHTIIQRDSLVLNMNKPEAREAAKQIRCMLKDPSVTETFGDDGKYRLPDENCVAQFVDVQLRTPLAERSTALYPVVRSYYIAKQK